MLAGTFPIGIDVEDSDLDILCYAPKLEIFADAMVRNFANAPAFAIRHKHIRARPVLIARFESGGMPFEIFGEAVPVEQQQGIRHMLVEHRLLQLGGKALRERIWGLRKAGLKTEPGFAQALRLPGDSYEALLRLEQASDADLHRVIGQAA